MKNILLLFVVTVITLCASEAALRYIFLPRLRVHVSVAPMIFLKRGYYVNPSSGSSRDQFQNHIAYYHFYPPHLRDTKVNPKAEHILALGDSFTFGWLLPWKKTYIYQLQQDVNKTFGKNKYQFLDAAVGGWGTADYLSYLEDYGSQISPKIVVVFLNTDDIGRSITRNIYQLLGPQSLQLVRTPHPIARYPHFREWITNPWLFAHSVLWQSFRYIITELYSNYRHAPDCLHGSFLHGNDGSIGFAIPQSLEIHFKNTYAIQYSEALFLRMNQWCLEHHAKLLVIEMGYSAFYPKHIHDPTQTFLAVAPAFFAKEHIAFYNSSTPFKKIVQGQQFWIPIDNHPSAVGARAIATVSWPWIKKQMVN